ncbi:MAG: site-specific DNA-methyltransferase, partial [Pseudomonadota bacterium]
YANTITAERIRRVAKGVPDAKDAMLRNGLGGAFSFCTLSPTPLNAERMLDGKQLPSFLELARHAFYIATGDHLDEQQIDEKSFYCGADRTGGPVYLLYQSDPEALRELTLNLDLARAIRAKHKDSLGRMVEKIVFAPQSFLEDDDLRAYGIRFCQLPFDIFRIV